MWGRRGRLGLQYCACSVCNAVEDRDRRNAGISSDCGDLVARLLSCDSHHAAAGALEFLDSPPTDVKRHPATLSGNLQATSPWTIEYDARRAINLAASPYHLTLSSKIRGLNMFMTMALIYRVEVGPPAPLQLLHVTQHTMPARPLEQARLQAATLPLQTLEGAVTQAARSVTLGSVAL